MICYLGTNLHRVSASRFKAFIAKDYSEIETLRTSGLIFKEKNSLFKFRVTFKINQTSKLLYLSLH
jgi:hypothetical protein